MKRKNRLILAFLPVLMVAIWSFSSMESSGVRGLVSPVEGVQSVLLISGKDTLKNTPLNGHFAIESKPGIYQVLIDATKDYKDMLLERVIVEEGRMTDMGELILQKNIP